MLWLLIRDTAQGVFFLTGREIWSVWRRRSSPRYIRGQAGWSMMRWSIWSSQYGVAAEAMAKIGADAGDIDAIGITNQRETTIVWDRNTGVPVYNAICWQCHRTADRIDELKAQGYDKLIKSKTGLVPDAYFSATKIGWILDNVEGVRKKAEAGELLFGTVDTWLIWKLSKGRIFVTDYTNASRTMLFNIHTRSWDDELLELFGVPRSMLAQVRPSSCIYGTTDEGAFRW